MPFSVLPTHCTANSTTLIDHIFANFGVIESKRVTIKSLTVNTDITDHYANLVVVTSDNKKLNYAERPYIRIYNSTNIDNYQGMLAAVDWSCIYNCSSLDESVSILTDVLSNHYNTCFPLVRCSRKSFRDKNWINKELKKRISVKNRLFFRYKNSNSKEDESLYKAYKKDLDKLLDIQRKQFFQKLFDSRSNSIKKIWKSINNICCFKKSNDRPGISHITTNQGSCTSSGEIAQIFNNYFSSIGNSLASKINQIPNGYKDYLLHPNVQSMFIDPVTVNEVYNTILNLNKSNSTGSDDLTTRAIQLSANFVAPVLTFIINNSFVLGEFPKSFKIAKVTPIHKKGSTVKVENYRPISLLSNLSKIFEKLMYRRLYSFLTNYDLLYDKQFGFRKDHSTVDAIINAINMISMEHGRNKCVIGIFFDLAKAFDTVDHSILLSKLEYYGVRGIVYEWFKSYLSGRHQYTIVNKSSSALQNISIGVPQGSILGPLLFLIYINDIRYASNIADLTLFADDSNAFVSGNSLVDAFDLANRACAQLSTWFSSNALSVNYDKTCFIIFHPSKEDLNVLSIDAPNYIIQMDGILINRVFSVKFLGIMIDQHLNFKEHVNFLISKLNCIRGMFYSRRAYLPFSCRKKLYYALIYSLLQYGIEVYSLTSKYILDGLQIACNRVLRSLQCADRFANVKSLYCAYNTLPVSLLGNLCISKLIYRSLIISNDNCFSSNATHILFQLNHTCHNYQTRLSATNYLYKKPEKAFLSSYVNKCCTIWNNIPITIRNSSSAKSFIIQYQKYLLDNW